MKHMATLVVLDDNLDVLTACRLCLKPHVEKVITIHEPSLLAELLQQQKVDLLLLDMNFHRDASSGEEGLFYLKQALQHQPDLKVLMMTAYAEVPLVVRAMQLGAKDFIAKPWNNEQLLSAVRQQLTSSIAASPKPVSAVSDEQMPLLGESPAMLKIKQLIQKAAATDANILLTGESGTGKALVASAIHQASARRQQALVTVDMGVIQPTLFESELFGHKKGAFTDAKADYRGRILQAQGGTLFLDELGNLPLAQQAKLLSTLQNRMVLAVGSNQAEPFNVRLICASNEDLAEKTKNGGFRQDLLYRVNTIEIRLPPLRERQGDVELLFHWYLKFYSDKYQRPGLRIVAADLQRLSRFDWPGNVRQLAHAVERAVVLAEQGLLDFSQLFQPVAAVAPIQQDFMLEEVEERTIRQALQFTQGNVSQSAKMLGLTRAALYRRMEKYQL